MANENNQQTAPTVVIKETSNFALIDAIITGCGANTGLKITRNSIERQMDILKIQKRDDKGKQYYGISVTPETLEFVQQFLGDEIVCDILHTALNVKMQSFADNALIKCKENNPQWNNISVSERCEQYKAELSRMVENWSMRDVSMKKLQEEMGALGLQYGKALAEGKADEVLKITTRLGELAQLMAKKQSEE